MDPSFLFWLGFHVLILGLLVVDLCVFNRKDQTMSFKKACLLSGFWIFIALLFNYFIYLYFGKAIGLQFLTGYIIEKSLSVDNLFLFLMIFSYFEVPRLYQHKILFWGIIGVLFFRITLILAGIAILNLFHWMFYVFGLLLIVSGIKLLYQKNSSKDILNNRFFSWLKTQLPTTSSYRGDRFFIKESGRWKITPLFLVLLLIELTDVMLALDSIPAIFAVTTDPFIVYTSNILAILGLRSLYFVLASFLKKLHYLKAGLSLILVFVGLKMVISNWMPISTLQSLSVIALILIGTVIASFIKQKRKRDHT